MQHQDTAPPHSRPIDDFPGYLVSFDDGIWSEWTCGPKPRRTGRWHRLKPVPGTSGHLAVFLCATSRRLRVGVHVLVAKAFLPPPRPDQWQVRHLDGDPTNNVATNLAWGNQVENEADKKRHGRRYVGSQAPGAKLTEAQVAVIKSLPSPIANFEAVGREYGVTGGMIRRIRSGLAWRHVQ